MATQNAESEYGGDLPPAVVQELLSEDSRRRALAILESRGEPVVVQALAAEIVATEEECPVSAVSESEREAKVAELFSDHLPKLMATDVVAYDSMLGAVDLRTDDIARQT